MLHIRSAWCLIGHATAKWQNIFNAHIVGFFRGFRCLGEELESLLQNLSGTATSVTETVGEYAKQAKDQLAHVSDAARDQYDRMSESMRDGYRESETTVRKHPAESVAVAFGTGLIAGVLIGMTLRR